MHTYASRNEVLVEHGHGFVDTLSLAAAAPWRHSHVVVTETGWPTEPKILTLRPFMEKGYGPLNRSDR